MCFLSLFSLQGWTWPKMGSMLFVAVFIALQFATGLANPEAKRLYDDLLSNYNRLIRPVGNNSDRLTVKMGLRLSQLIDVVSIWSLFLIIFSFDIHIQKHLYRRAGGQRFLFVNLSYYCCLLSNRFSKGCPGHSIKNICAATFYFHLNCWNLFDGKAI